jgi:hypothetical protein
MIENINKIAVLARRVEHLPSNHEALNSNPSVAQISKQTNELQWFTPVIPFTWLVETKRIVV